MASMYEFILDDRHDITSFTGEICGDASHSSYPYSNETRSISARRRCPAPKKVILCEGGAFVLMHAEGYATPGRMQPPTSGSVEAVRRRKAVEEVVKGSMEEEERVADNAEKVNNSQAKALAGEGMAPGLTAKKKDLPASLQRAQLVSDKPSDCWSWAVKATALSAPAPAKCTKTSYAVSKLEQQASVSITTAPKASAAANHHGIFASQAQVQEKTSDLLAEAHMPGSFPSVAAVAEGIQEDSPADNGGEIEDNEEWDLVEAAPLADDYVVVRKWF